MTRLVLGPPAQLLLRPPDRKVILVPRLVVVEFAIVLELARLGVDLLERLEVGVIEGDQLTRMGAT